MSSMRGASLRACVFGLSVAAAAGCSTAADRTGADHASGTLGGEM